MLLFQWTIYDGVAECIHALRGPEISHWRLPDLFGRSFNRNDDIPGKLVLLLFVCFVPVGVGQLGKGGWWLGGSRLFIYGHLTLAGLLAIFWADGGWQLGERGPYAGIMGALVVTLTLAVISGAALPRPRRGVIWLQMAIPTLCTAGALCSTFTTGEPGQTIKWLFVHLGVFSLACVAVAVVGGAIWVRRHVIEGASLAVASLWVLAALTCFCAVIPYH